MFASKSCATPRVRLTLYVPSGSPSHIEIEGSSDPKEIRVFEYGYF